MATTPRQPAAADADTQACALDENDPLLKDPINDQWLELADDRMCREYARQLIQQEKMPMTTNNLSRRENVRILDMLDRELERIARRRAARGARTATKKIANAHDAFNALERSILPDLKAAAVARDSEKDRA